MLRNTLLFFDSKGDNLNFNFDNKKDCWVGSIFFPKTSIDIINLYQFFCFSSAQYLGEEKLVKPLSDVDIDIKFELLDLSDADNEVFYFYDRVDDNIELKKEKVISLSSSNFTINEEGEPVLLDLDEEIFYMPFVFKPKSKGNFSTIARVYYYDQQAQKDVKILELFLFGEGENEDERFPIAMNNLGIDPDITNDYQVFKQTNPKEPLADWNIINNKRKELLFSYDQIIPFTGTYKGIKNAISYYGYDNIQLKEWWKNVNPNSDLFGTYKTILIEEQPPESSLWKKTGLFTLVYQMNKVDYSDIEGGLPVVTNEFDFSSEEILQKLSLLRDKIEKHHSPIFSKIVDVVGEYTLFSRLNLNVWLNDTRINFIKQKRIDFDIDVQYSYIEDLRELNPPALWENMGQDISIEGDYYIGQLKGLNINSNKNLYDAPTAKIGSKFKLSLKISPTFGDLSGYRLSKLSKLSIENLKFVFYYGIRWSIFNSKKERVFFVEGNIKDLYEVEAILEVSDDYTVKVELIDRYNQIANRIKEKAINLKNKEVNFTGFYQYSPRRNSLLDFKKRKIKTLNFTFSNSRLDENRIKLKDLRIRIKNLKKMAYWKSSLLERLKISEIRIPIKETVNKRIKHFNPKISKNSHFKIKSIDILSPQSLTIKGRTLAFSSLTSSTDYLSMANEINSFFPEWIANPIQNSNGDYIDLIVVHKFSKKVNIDDISWTSGIELEPLPMENNYFRSNEDFTVKFINVKSGDYYITPEQGKVLLDDLGLGTDFNLLFSGNKNYNVYFGNNTNWSLISSKEGFIKNYNNIDFNINNIKWFEHSSEIFRFTRVYFNLDKSDARGIVNKKWTLTKQNSNFKKEVENKNTFHHLFIDKGVYDLKLELLDNKGNYTQKIKNKIIKVI